MVEKLVSFAVNSWTYLKSRNLHFFERWVKIKKRGGLSSLIATRVLAEVARSA